MTIRKLISSGAILALSCSVTMSAAAQSDKVGINSAVKGDVTIQSGDAEAVKAEISQPVFLGDNVNSGKKSTLQVLLLDETTFTVGPSCELTIDEFVYDPNAADNAISSTVKSGAFRFMSGNVSKSKKKKVTINSPIATMGVRGTIVEGVIGEDAIKLTRQSGALPSGGNFDAENATLFILRGPGQKTVSGVAVGAIDVSAGGQTVTIDRSGYATFVGANGMSPTPPFPISDKAHAFLSETLRTTAPDNKPNSTEPMELVDPVRDMDWVDLDNPFF